MLLRCTTRTKSGKEHRYFSIVENQRVADGRVVQRHVLCLGEINTTQAAAWRKTIEGFEDGQPRRGPQQEERVEEPWVTRLGGDTTAPCAW